MPEDRRRPPGSMREERAGQPSHPRIVAALLMVGVVVVVIALAAFLS